MSSTHDMTYKGKTARITVAATGNGTFIGSYVVEDTDPLVTGSGADSSSSEGALSSAEHHARHAIDRVA